MRTFLGTLFLRLGVSFALLYPAVMAFVNPDKWSTALPSILTAFVAPKTLLIMLAGYEILFAALILLKPDPSLPAGIVFLTFVIFTILSFKDFDLVYQNATVALSALALAFFGKIRG